MLQSAKLEYSQAMKMGLKECKDLAAAGKDPYPAVLDNILPNNNLLSVQEVPTMEIPVDLIAGIKTAGRTAAFSAGFLPILAEDSEFAAKWVALCDAHLSDEGIRDPILCYEYMGRFYVQEGNKRVSVLKYFGAARIPAVIKRVLPESWETPREKAYQEFLDFFKIAGIYDIQYTKPGNYARLQARLGKDPDEKWTEDERRSFLSSWTYFRDAFTAVQADHPEKELGAENALLLWLQIYPYKNLAEMSGKELKKSISALWDDVVTTAAPEKPAKKLETAPVSTEPENKSLISKIITKTATVVTGSDVLKIAFIYQGCPECSNWTRGHDQGRAYLEEALGDKISVRTYSHADSPEQVEALLQQAVDNGAQVVFTTTPPMVHETLKAAVKYPKVKFLNCSADTPYSSVRSYYCRTYEGKFITGAIAGALADDNRIGYVGSYPILGVPASINAFALGAQMTNPRAKVYLDWSCLPGSATQRLMDMGCKIISNRDVPTSDPSYLEFGEFGTFQVQDDGRLTPLASPIWKWGKLYENIVRSVLAGTYTQRKGNPEAVNYWWGMDSGVIDVEFSPELPESQRALTKLLLRDLSSGSMDPFRREITAQDGTLKNDGVNGFEPQDLLHMDWLCSNVIGSFPKFEELMPMSQPLVRVLGIHRELIPPEKADASEGL